MVEDTFEWHGIRFESGVPEPKMLKTQPGIYLIFTKQKLLDIGEGGDVQARVTSHDRKECWQRHAAGATIFYGAHYLPGVPEQTRMDLESKLRAMNDYPCGER